MYTSIVSRLGLIGIALASSGCVTRYAASVPGVDRAVGCYVLRIEGDSSHGGWFPDTIALLPSRQKDALVQNGRDVRISRRQARLHSVLQFGWRSAGTDSLEIWGSSGFFGVEFKGRLTAGGLEGSAASFTDVVDPDPLPRRAVIGLRSRCLGFESRAT